MDKEESHTKTGIFNKICELTKNIFGAKDSRSRLSTVGTLCIILSICVSGSNICTSLENVKNTVSHYSTFWVVLNNHQQINF